MKRILLGVLLLSCAACLGPVAENQAGASSASTGSDAGLDAGAADAGTTTSFTGVVRPDCAPTDALAYRFVLDGVSVTCASSAPAGLTVQVWSRDLSPRTLTFIGSAFGGAGNANLCNGTACVGLDTGTFTITEFVNGVVVGTFDLHFLDGSTRKGSFSTPVCAVGDGGLPPVLCG